MKVGVLGTGMVGRTLAGKLSVLGHDVVVGTRNVERTLANAKADAMGTPPYSEWQKANPNVRLAPLADAARHGEVVVNATSGMASLDALKAAGPKNLHDKLLLDVANPLDFSDGMPPTLAVANTDSLGEQVQTAHPRAKVVKTLCTVTAPLMVNPQAVGGGQHDVFLSGNDAAAKAQASEILRSFGWKAITDLGDITTARGQEMMLPMWVRLFMATGSPMFNWHIVR